MKEKRDSIVTKKMYAFAFTAPFLFSVGGMIIVLFTMQNSPQRIRNITLIIVTFLGLLLAVGSIFLIQLRINKKITEQQKED